MKHCTQQIIKDATHLSLYHFMRAKLAHYTSLTPISRQLCTDEPIVWGDMKVGITNLHIQYCSTACTSKFKKF